MASGFQNIPDEMQAAVYESPGRVVVRSVPVPRIGPGELLVKVEACGICGTDLKKISHALQPPPRIYGHEFAGTIAAAGSGAGWMPGQRVAVYHHVPCRTCYLCRRRAYSQCPAYRKTGTTAGFEPAGGGWAQYTRVMDWIVRDGVVEIPPGVSFEQASLMEPLNTCLKCVNAADVHPGELAVIFGQGPVGLMLTQLCALKGAVIIGVDLVGSRRARAVRYGATTAVDPAAGDIVDAAKSLSDGRGADVAFVATPAESAVRSAIDATRPAGRIILFAQTEKEQIMSLPAGQVCVLEKRLLGSYSSSIDLNDEVARLLFDNVIPAGELVTHRFPLSRISDAIDLAGNPAEDSLKIIITPGREEA